jgi:hypothetical protein
LHKTLIHIGYPKTGTTWFVDNFYPLVRNATVVYNRSIFFDISEKNEFFEIKCDGPVDEKKKQIVITHKFSGIVDFRWENGKYRYFFSNNLKKNFPDAGVVVFLRKQADFIASVYSSYLTHGGTFTFKKLHRTGRLADGQMFSFEYLDYPKLLQIYSNCFGAENIHVFLYEEFKDDNRKFIQHFIKYFDIEIDPEKICFDKTNEKLRKGLASFVRFANLFSKNGVQPKTCIAHVPWLFSWLNRNTIEKMNKYSVWGKRISNRKILGDELAGIINEYYKDSNRKLSEYVDTGLLRKHGYIQ